MRSCIYVCLIVHFPQHSLKVSPVLKVQHKNYITVQFAAGGALVTNEEVTLQAKA